MFRKFRGRDPEIAPMLAPRGIGRPCRTPSPRSHRSVRSLPDRIIGRDRHGGLAISTGHLLWLYDCCANGLGESFPGRYNGGAEARGHAVNDELEFLRYLADRLDETRLPYMLTGSMAMMFYAVPRMTRDIDFVVECRAEDVPRVLEVFRPDCYVSEEAVREAVTRSGMFNIIHTGWIIKADLVVRRQSPYRELEFTRRRTMVVGDLSVAVVSPEDLILSRLDWARDSASASQYQDVSQLLAAASGLDVDYLEHYRRGPAEASSKSVRRTAKSVCACRSPDNPARQRSSSRRSPIRFESMPSPGARHTPAACRSERCALLPDRVIGRHGLAGAPRG